MFSKFCDIYLFPYFCPICVNLFLMSNVCFCPMYNYFSFLLAVVIALSLHCCILLDFCSRALLRVLRVLFVFLFLLVLSCVMCFTCACPIYFIPTARYLKIFQRFVDYHQPNKRKESCEKCEKVFN